MQLRPSLFVCSLAITPFLACNNILGLEHAELPATASSGGANHGKAGQAAVGGSDIGSSPAGGSVSGNAGGEGTLGASGSGAIADLGGFSGATASTNVDDMGGSTGVTAISGGSDAGGATPSDTGGQPSGFAGQAGCAAGAGSVLGACDVGPNQTFVCIEGWLTSCGADGTPISQQCDRAELCDATNGQCDICVANTTSCANDHQTALCNGDGQEQTHFDCTETTPYCSSGACVACLADTHCADPGECLEPACSTEHRCTQMPAAIGSACVSGSTPGICDGDGHCGSCKPGVLRCAADGRPELCVSSGTAGGQWVPQDLCNTSTSLVPYTCVAGRCEPPPSCRTMPAGQVAQCGIDQTRHCCESPGVYGMEYVMGTSDSTDPNVNAREMPAHKAWVGAFRLDAFEVTVGRFRRFVADYQGPPAAGTGGDPYQPELTGWNAEWNAQLPVAGPGAAAAILALIQTNIPGSTWTDVPGNREAYPINQVPWYLAFAFCAYDGGWLPSEAEWEAVASGGETNTKNYYPWGNKDAAPNTDRATYAGSCPAPSCTVENAFRRVGSAPLGVSAFGQYDMAGNVAEWMMDYYDATYYEQFAPSRCNYCVNTTVPATPLRSTRGGHALSSAAILRVTARGYYSPASWSAGIGFRCARPR